MPNRLALQKRQTPNPPVTIQNFPSVKLWRKYPTKHNKNLFGFRKLLYGGLFISRQLFTSESPQMLQQNSEDRSNDSERIAHAECAN